MGLSQVRAPHRHRIDDRRWPLNGPGTTTVVSGATLTVPSSFYVEGGTLVSQGSAAIQSSGYMLVDSGATFLNQGGLTMASSSELDGGCAIAATPTSPAIPAGAMTSTGTITANATPGFPVSLGGYNNYDCLVLNDTGPIQIAANELDLYGTTNLNSGATITGPASTTLGIDGTTTVNPGASISGPGTINEDSSLVLNTNLSVPTFSNGGSVSGPGNLTVTGSMTGGGRLNGPGTTTVVSGATLTVPSSFYVEGGTLVSQGSAAIQSSGYMLVDSGATFLNQGGLTMASSSELDGGCAIAATPTSPAIPAGAMTSTGTITANATPGFPVSLGGYNNYDCLVLNDTGPIQIAANELDLYGTTNLNSGSNDHRSGVDHPWDRRHHHREPGGIDLRAGHHQRQFEAER